MKRLDDQEEEKYVKACIYGPPGSGKTTFGVTAPKPLIAVTERQAMVHIREAARRLGTPLPQVFYIEEANDLRNLVRSLGGDRSQPFKVFEKHGNDKICVHQGEWPDTFVLDSATDACRLLVEEIRRESPPKRGNDGLPVDSQRFWNVLIQRAEMMITYIRDLPMHAVFLALSDDRDKGDEDNKQRSLVPLMATKGLGMKLAAAVNVVGYTYRKTKRGQPGKQNTIEYGIQTTGPEYMTTKPYRPLRDTEVPDFGYWIRVIRGEVAPDAQEAPSPTAEMGAGDVSDNDKAIASGESEAEAEPAAATPAADTTEASAAPPRNRNSKKREERAQS